MDNSPLKQATISYFERPVVKAVFGFAKTTKQYGDNEDSFVTLTIFSRQSSIFFHSYARDTLQIAFPAHPG
jgi:hypothetical protein